MNATQIISAIKASKTLPETERVQLFNACTRALAEMLCDVSSDPVLAVQLIPTEQVTANDYNPNRVATPEMELLHESIAADGVTMPVVVIKKPSDGWVTVDGFHRQRVLREMKRKYIPCSVIDSDKADAIASTVRHNRARGKHQVDLMAAIVKRLMDAGWEDADIARKVGMTPDELLRLKQTVGIAKLMAGSEYAASWGLTSKAKKK